MLKKAALITLSIASLNIASYTLAEAQIQAPDKGNLIEYKNPYWKEIKTEVEKFEKGDDKKKKSFKMDFSNQNLPKSHNDFKKAWHLDPISQGWTGTCWCFSTTSMLESEIFRIHKKKIDISELYTVYWEYVEKAREYIKTRGTSHFSEGSQGNAVMRMWKKYGCVPAKTYTGLKTGQKFHGHKKMFGEMETFLKSLNTSCAWNEEAGLETIKSILDHYLGAPPKSVDYEGKSYSPKDFMTNVTKLNMDDYVDIASLMEVSDYWKKGVYPAEDNWWKSGKYNNVPLDDFMKAIRKAVSNGYSMMIGGDVSETGYYSFKDVAMVPSYDIPSKYIDENARQFRFSNGSTGDDHAIHVVGHMEKDGQNWYLIKDSGSGARNGNSKGYYFYHEDYIKLKMMNFLIHKSAVSDLLKKMK